MIPIQYEVTMSRAFNGGEAVQLLCEHPEIRNVIWLPNDHLVISLERSFDDVPDERRIKSYIEQTLAGVQVLTVEPRGPARGSANTPGA